MNVNFSNKAVADRFTCEADTDVTINTNRYHGPISGIDEVTAEYLLETKYSLIKEKNKANSKSTGDPNK